MHKYRRGLLPSTMADLKKGGIEECHNCGIFFTLMDVVLDCILCSCVVGKDYNLQWEHQKHQVLITWTVISVIFCVIEMSVFCSVYCRDEETNGECSDVIFLGVLWIEDVPKAILNAEFVVNIADVPHMCCLCKAVFVVIRAVVRSVGVVNQYDGGRNEHFFLNLNGNIEKRRVAYALGIVVEVLGAICVIYNHFGSKN